LSEVTYLPGWQTAQKSPMLCTTHSFYKNYSHTSPFGNNISHTQSLLHFQIIQELVGQNKNLV